MPARASPSMRRRIGREDGALGVPLRGVRGRVLEVGDGDVGALDQGAERAGVAGPLGVRQVPAERRAVLAAAGDVGRPAVEREVGALALDVQGLVHAAVEHDVAAGEQRPGRRRVVGGAGGGGRQSRGQRPGGEILDPVDPEQRRVAPVERADLGPDRVGAQEGEPLAVLREVRRERRLAGGQDQPRAVGRPGDAEGRQDRIGLAGDELDRLVAVAGPGQRRLDLGQVRRGRRRPEVRDRDDRGRRRAGRTATGRSGSMPATGSGYRPRPATRPSPMAAGRGRRMGSASRIGPATSRAARAVRPRAGRRR